MRGATVEPSLADQITVSIHAPHARGDEMAAKTLQKFLFQFTPLMRGATRRGVSDRQVQRFNSRPSCEGRLGLRRSPIILVFQFTPLMRGATVRRTHSRRRPRFNSRPSCEGRLPRRRGRRSLSVSIHAPHARGDNHTRRLICVVEVSIHAPHARGDTPARRGGRPRCFNSRPSCEGRRDPADQGRPGMVSIHAPHARGDAIRRSTISPARFNSRPSCEGRRPATFASSISLSFNSRPSCEGRHSHACQVFRWRVSIHAPHARGDVRD